MRRSLLALCLIISSSACVNLSKPKDVAECAATNSCQDVKKDGGIDGSGIDGVRADRPSDVKRDTGRDTGPGLDVTPGTGDALPGVDGGFDPDVPVVMPDAGDDVGPGLPDVPLGPDTALDGPPAPDARDVSRDVPAGACAPGGVVQPAGTVCRAAVSVCDVDETCDGVNADCPADVLAAAGKECRAAAGDCDIAETCSGASPECPADGFKQSGTVCRPAAGVCDYAEVCSGTGPACPNDALKQSSASCRDATGVCDPAESCTGLAAECPEDVPAYARPSAPGTITATPGELQASLAWGAVAGATAYNIKRATTAGGPYTTIARAVASSPFVDVGLDSTKTYYYVVSSINTIASCESAANSAEASVKPTGICVKPAAPVVTATAGNGRVTLTWAAITGATAYAVDRSEASGTGYSSLAQVLPPATTYLDQAVTFGKTYYYRVTTKAACDSEPSAEASAAPLCTPPATTPTGLAATAPNTGGLVVLTWNAVEDAKTSDRYYIMRKPATASSYTKLDEIAPPTVTYSDTTAVNGTAYDYAITYFNGTCTSGSSTAARATAACVMAKPVLTTTAGNKKVELAWTQPPNGSLTGYDVYRKDTGSYAKITSLTGAGNTTYVDTGVSNDVTYTYYITAIGNCNASSDTKTAAPVCTPLAAPTNLEATAGNTQVTLTWSAVAGADHYTVKRGATTGGPYTALAPASPITTNSYTDTGLINGTTYFYVVTVSNGTCDSADSTESSAMPRTCPSQGPPGDPILTITPSTQVAIAWGAATPAPTGGYNILRGTSVDGPYVPVGSVDADTLAFTDPTDSEVGRTYHYRVEAIGTECTNSSASASIALTCSPLAPPSVVVTANPTGTIDVSWDPPVTGATAYTVSRRTEGTSHAPIPAATNITTTSYRDSGLANTTDYYYVVTASSANQQCVSLASTEKSARSCVTLAAPTGVTATRTGNNRVTVAWTNVTGALSYYVQRSDGTNVRTASGSPFVDATAANGSSFTYVLSTASDASGVCNSPNSDPSPAAPSCLVMGGGTTSYALSPHSGNAYCFVTCYDIEGLNLSNQQGRTLRINGSLQSCPPNGNCQPPTLALPAKNGGYVFQIGACPDSVECYHWPATTWWGPSHTCQ